MFTYTKDQTAAAREAANTARTMYAQSRSKDELVEILELLTSNPDAYEEYGKPNKLQLVDTLQVMAAEVLKVDNREQSAAYYMEKRDGVAEDNLKKLRAAESRLEEWVEKRLRGTAFEIMNGLEWMESAYECAGEIEARAELDSMFFKKDDVGERVRREEVEFDAVVSEYSRKARNKAAWVSSSTSSSRNAVERERIKWYAKVADELVSLQEVIQRRELF